MSRSTLGAMLGEAEIGKPGTNWSQVTPENRKKVNPLVRHYMKQAHPFTACVRDNRKRFGDNAERVCAVVKDMGKRGTGWRGKGKVDEAEDRVARLDEALGEGVALELAANGSLGEDATQDALAELALGDFGILWLAGRDPDGRIAEAFGWPPAVAEDFSPAQAPIVARKESPSAKDGKSKRSGGGGSDDSKHPRGRKGTSEGGRFVKSGSSGDDVKSIQGKVGAKTDGAFGKQTEAKVRAFQAKHGLTVDGVVGHQTALALAGRTEAAKKAKTGALRGSDRAALKLKGERSKRSERLERQNRSSATKAARGRAPKKKGEPPVRRGQGGVRVG